MKTLKTTVALSLMLLSAATQLPVYAQAFPNKPIKVVIGFPAGGPVDQHARLLTDKLQSVLGQPILPIPVA